jgi:hypothetical protein
VVAAPNETLVHLAGIDDEDEEEDVVNDEEDGAEDDDDEDEEEDVVNDEEDGAEDDDDEDEEEDVVNDEEDGVEDEDDDDDEEDLVNDDFELVVPKGVFVELPNRSEDDALLEGLMIPTQADAGTIVMICAMQAVLKLLTKTAWITPARLQKVAAPP